MTAAPTRPAGSASRTTQRAVALVAERRPLAEELGRELAPLTDEPDAFAATLRDGLVNLADDDYRDGQQRVAPGIGPIHGVRWPLLAAIERGLRNATRGERTTPFLALADVPEGEPNNQPAQAQFVGCGNSFRPASLTNTAVRDTDWIALNANAGDLITFETAADAPGPETDTVISLIEVDGSTGDIHVRAAELHGTSVGGAEVPGLIDEIAVLAVAATVAGG